MERIFLFFLVLVCVDGFTTPGNTKITKSSEESEHIRKIGCNYTLDQIRNDYIERSKCGEPKEVFVELKIPGSFLQVSPSSVWVKRCVGLCDYDAPNTVCVATKKRTEEIPVRIYNLKIKKEFCSLIKVEVHESCGCCLASAKDCGARRVYNPRKCSCQCPNMEERRNCLKKRSQNMKWNRYKCTCELKRRAW